MKQARGKKISTASKATPIRKSLKKESELQILVENGLGAVEKKHHNYIDQDLREDFSDSLNLDEAMRVAHQNDNRWDYLFGHTPSGTVVGLEPHSAKNDEISTVIRKRKMALDQLRDHLKPGVKVISWFWVASGVVDFADTERTRRQLDENGVKFVGKILLKKHI